MTRPSSTTLDPEAGLLAPQLDDLGVTAIPGGGRLRVWSQHATGIELVIVADDDLDWITQTAPLDHVGGGVWQVDSSDLVSGARYALRVSGPRDGHVFNSRTLLMDPYSRGIIGRGLEDWRSAVVDERFDWGGSRKPRTPTDRTVIYEAHVKGLSQQHPDIPPDLHGTYAALAHPAMIAHLTQLGVTSVELLPVHAFASEPRLLQLGLSNYWGYNTVNFFSPHAAYATAAARMQGPDAVLREFKEMVRGLHEAGLEVILDVVYNHTAEAGVGGPRSSLRGLDNRSYYRQRHDGTYIDTTGCGNTVDTGTDAVSRLVLDSLRYWTEDVQIDGFRFDLAVALGRDDTHTFAPDHPLLTAIRDDPALAESKLIAEPWDVGLGGWQTGAFRDGWGEWNDLFRDRVRNFWLSDVDYQRRASVSPAGVGGFATRLAGSSNTFSAERGPLASINFVTAHDGFTLHDVVSYDVKHNVANGEHNRDGADTNRSFNHGAEGATDDPGILATRRKAMRNLVGTLLLSAGVPMITAGDEIGRSQRGNNNAYCHDSSLTWMGWEWEDWQRDLLAHVQTLTRLRRENPALRPTAFAHAEERVPGASVMDWYDENGDMMSIERWNDPSHRTLQYLATSTPQSEHMNRVLLIVHGAEREISITLPHVPDVARYVPLWSSEPDRPGEPSGTVVPGSTLALAGASMRLFRGE